jgi:hypothetical protein
MIKKSLFTSANANKISKVKSSPYFTKDEGKKYCDAISNAVSKLGYKCIMKTSLSDTVYFHIYPSRINKNQYTLKNLICSVQAKNYIDWGPNDLVKSKLEKPILDAIASVNK